MPATRLNPREVIKAILRNPEVAKKRLLNDRLDDPEEILLLKVIDYFRKNPELSVSTLMAQWYGTDDGDLLKRIASEA